MASDVQTQQLRSKRNAGQTIGYRVYRSANARSQTPLFLVQGMSAVGTVDWHDLASVLVQDRTVVTLDNRDMHDSAWTVPDNEKTFSLQHMADDVIELAQVGLCATWLAKLAKAASGSRLLRYRYMRPFDGR